MSNCKVCKGNHDLTQSHKGTKEHALNYLLFEWTNYRKKLAKDKNGIKVAHHIKTNALRSKSTVTEEKKGRYTLTVTSEELLSVNNEIQFGLTILNERVEDVMYIMKATVLIPYEAFHIDDKCDSCIENTIIPLKPKHKYEYNVNFKLIGPLIGNYKIPLAFTFQEATNETVSFSIAKQIEIRISDFETQPEDEHDSPFKFGIWHDVQIHIPPVSAPRQSNNFCIPERLRRIFMTGLNDYNFNPDEMHLLNYVKNVLCPNYHKTGMLVGQYPTEDNYQDFFHFLLWIDEVMQKLMLQRFNMSKVKMNVVGDNMLELKVPGLAEKRPSLVAGDIVNIRFHEGHIVYKAIVSKINDKTIWINKMHIDLFEKIKQNNQTELDVAFEINRLSYERMHKAIDECVKKNLLKLLFPSETLAKRGTINKFVIPDERFLNKSILKNLEQKTAVANILNCTSKEAPYIVFGPPGTGKTLTIVEAILQIAKHLTTSKILVCAPANAACDMLTEKLIPFVSKNELIRIHTETRLWNDIPEHIKKYSNHDGTNFIRITYLQLSKYRIVVTTLGLIGKYSGHYDPDFVFIDEAAQALEPEADIAISMLTLGKQLVLAGDPKQLGPQCASKLAAGLKLENSLLERLMDTNELYQSGNEKFITMLKQNYRAHPQVLHIPNKLFYNSQLNAISREAANDPIAKIFIHPLIVPRKGQKKLPGKPIEFCSVIAKEQREGKSPSYFNEPEIQMVVKYIKALLSLPNIKVEESEIGVISPYIRQVHRIKNRLQQSNRTKIEVGTTEAFQGREKRIIIMSTVRGQNNLLLVDKKYNLGFVGHEKRMNVALTRAKSKLIVIGNPHVLGTDKNWEEYIKYCEENNAFFGAQYLRRTKDVRNEIINRFNGIKFEKSTHRFSQDVDNNQRRRGK